VLPTPAATPAATPCLVQSNGCYGTIHLYMRQSEHPSILSRLLFLWVTPLMRHPSASTLNLEHLPLLPDTFSVEPDLPRFEKARARWSGSALLRPLCAIFYREVFTAVALSMLLLVVSFTGPLLLRQILSAIGGTPAPIWFVRNVTALFGWYPERAYGIACAVALAINSAIGILGVHHIFFLQPMLGFRVRSLFNHMIFQKALRKQRSAAGEMSSGFVLNLVATDTLKLQILIGFLHSIWMHPLTIVIASMLLYWMVGPPALLGSSTLLILLAVSVVISRKQARLRSKLFLIADSRVGLTRETLLHIKSAKLQGWELNLAQKIQALRADEARLGRALARLSAVMSFTAGTAPAVAMATTATCIALGGGPLDAPTLFPMLALFVLQRFSLNILPETVYNLMEASIALKRIRSFLSSPEFSPPQIKLEHPHALSLSNITAVWPDGIPALSVSQLSIARGELVAVVGSVGAGKSSLLLTILGELRTTGGDLHVGGSIGYVAQNSWVISDTIRNTILSGKSFEPERYRTAVRASGLLADINSLPHGDATQIGERGINLSGGQRQRVALARAYYHDADLYLFDDPLSALDPSVANQVFSQLICTELAHTTRILVTHRVEFALAADRVIVIENGAIIEEGTPKALQSRPSRFAELLSFHDKITPEIPPTSTPSAGSLDEHDDLIEAEADPASGRLIEREDRQVGAVARSVISEYISLLAPGGTLVLIAALFLGRQLAAVGTDLWLAHSSATPQLKPHVFILGYLLCILTLCFLSYHRSLYILTRGLDASVNSHERLLGGVLHAPLRFFESNPVGRILNRFSRDLETVELGLPRSLLDAGNCLCEIILICLVIGVFAPITIAILIPIALAYVLLFRVYRPIAREVQRLCSISLSPIFTVFSESLSGVETLRASGLQSLFSGRFITALNRNLRVLYAQTATNRWLGIRLELLAAALTLIVGLVTCLGWDIAAGVAFSGLVLCYTSSMNSSMNWAIRSITMTESNLTSFERMERYASTPSEARNGAIPPSTWPERGEIALQSLEVRYRPELPPALTDISCRIPAGSRVGVVGRTGSGKSTLILSLLRMIEPSAGYVEIDGVNLSSISLQALRSSLSVVPQEPVLFSGTLRETLDPFSEVTDETIIAAMERLQLSTLLASLPEGLNAPVHEGGFNFSSGQRQLLCLARALLRQSKVIILDEATAAIDVQTDYAIQRAIREEFRNATVLVIAHRLGTVLDSDYILALRGGRLAEFGPPAELLCTPGSLLSQFAREVQTTAVGV
jgi:ATP-binding cassette subfamily C (CFTR/MRP) protein 1